ncbi:transcriptional regulator [Haloarcula salinisoli]|uniref:Transcriptional regulator n=1 Tax=Haloarcula salinisoli TaxID=2487746 RepID=A0A8J7YL32_9EURY|nr:transcriptional regulator [Halomicroarcula salinisoli]MBX0304729.1 transcriptional regulator [Halomicroarcula salinisoli]
MNEVDDAVLEFFEAQDEGVALPPTVVWYNLHDLLEVIDKSRDTVARRMRKLTNRGLLTKASEERGYYQITQKGRDYLTGDIDAEELRIESEN